MSRINIAAKRSGDKLTATEFNEVVDAVNDNNDRIGQHATTLNTMNQSLSTLQEQRSQDAQNIRNLQQEHIPHEFYTQAEYDAKVAAGTVNENALTFVYED
jgi:hypothetical protein